MNRAGQHVAKTTTCCWMQPDFNNTTEEADIYCNTHKHTHNHILPMWFPTLFSYDYIYSPSLTAPYSTSLNVWPKFYKAKAMCAKICLAHFNVILYLMYAAAVNSTCLGLYAEWIWITVHITTFVRGPRGSVAHVKHWRNNGRLLGPFYMGLKLGTSAENYDKQRWNQLNHDPLCYLWQV